MHKNTTLTADAPAGAVLITGGTGAIGRKLTEKLLNKGYQVHHLVRKGSKIMPGTRAFSWDVNAGEIDPACIDGVDTIVHLAGEPVAGKAWSRRRKEQIVESRTASIRLVYRLMGERTNTVAHVVSASAVGFYGDRGDEPLEESGGPGNDFLANCCVEWEAAADEGPAGTRVVKLRTGIVLDKAHGALPPLAGSIRIGLGAALGNGRQWMPWIHIDDITGIYCFAIENHWLSGVFNMASPYPARNADFTRILARVLRKKLWLPRVPAIVLRLALGERSTLLLESTRISAEKIKAAGYDFSYVDLKDALKQIYG